MAHPITFKPQPIDPKDELVRELEQARREHAEALLSAYELLQSAHDQGILDLLRAIVGGRDVIAEKVGAGMALPETIAALRNTIALTRILASIDPEMLHGLSRAMAEAAAPILERQKETAVAKTAPLSSAGTESSTPPRPAFAVHARRDPTTEPPSLWQLYRRATSKDARRGMATMLGMLTSMGRAMRPKEERDHE
ncbi:hypothetical protein SAMN05421819_3131 [Bryocella elongata]|uniref:DUF1641 domain-containing protein n=1 Tax=Bryocella elongata TaxID=863522 RepID=A0A1H6AIB6_9BACT|nr:DUF1641 domain-containing protein [Bryocella elongata]SEG47496.1 hypothetical protein SAMN05421819_3131 [Bryocella elongata]